MKHLLSLCLLFSFVQISFSQKKEADKKEKKSYEDIISSEALTQDGLFKTHIVKGKHYFEIHDSLLNEEILVVSRISGFVKNLNFGGAGVKSRPQQVIRWQKIGEKLALRSVSYNSVASFEDPIYKSVRNNNFEPIIMLFDVEVEGEGTYVIAVDALFTKDIKMIGAMSDKQRENFGVKGLDSDRSIIKSLNSFPSNVEVRHILTYKGGDKLPDNQVTGTLSVEMNQSFIKLPETPMRPRLYDARVGYFSVSQTNYSLEAQRTEQERFITKWRLEPKDPEAYARGELVEPIKPIVFYLDPATPEKWRPYLKQGVNDWQPAFEKAGFKNAIYALDPPTKEENPDWSPEDVRYSVIRYVSTDIQNAMGPHVHDPRTGEIIESDIIWYHNVMKLLRNWFFIQTAAINPEARGVNFKEEVMGRLIQFVAAHEVGHTLGLPHNMGSSVAYPVDSLRSPSFTQKMGTAPSIMDYARFNYVAQPEDGKVGLMPNIGPYDTWSIMYGYKLIANTANKEEEKKILNNWIMERAGDPLYRFGRQRGLPLDPTAQTEDIGDDAIYASELGIKNLKRILPNIKEWAYEEGENYDEIKDLYQQVFNQFRRYMGHVTAYIGGVIEISTSQNQAEPSYQPVAKQKQEAALQFLNQHLFTSPKWLADPKLSRHFEPTGILERISKEQGNILNQLFNEKRAARLLENEALNVANSFSLNDLFTKTEAFIFNKLAKGESDIYDRNLQRLYIDQMEKILNSEESFSLINDIQTQARGSLLNIKKRFKKTKISNNVLDKHKSDLIYRIDNILNNNN